MGARSPAGRPPRRLLPAGRRPRPGSSSRRTPRRPLRSSLVRARPGVRREPDARRRRAGPPPRHRRRDAPGDAPRVDGHDGGLASLPDRAARWRFAAGAARAALLGRRHPATGWTGTGVGVCAVLACAAATAHVLVAHPGTAAATPAPLVAALVVILVACLALTLAAPAALTATTSSPTAPDSGSAMPCLAAARAGRARPPRDRGCRPRGRGQPRASRNASTRWSEQPGGTLVVRGEADVGEQVPVAGVEEEFGVRGSGHQFAGGFEVTFAGEERIGVHPMDLDRHIGRPARRIRRPGARVEEQRTARARPGLGELLRGHDAEREPAVDQFGGEVVGRTHAALDDLVRTPLRERAIPSSMESNVRPSKRSGVWTVWPARRRSSAKATSRGSGPARGGRAAPLACRLPGVRVVRRTVRPTLVDSRRWSPGSRSCVVWRIHLQQFIRCFFFLFFFLFFFFFFCFFFCFVFFFLCAHSYAGQTFMNMTRGYSPTGRFDPANSTSHVDQHSLAFHPHDPHDALPRQRRRRLPLARRGGFVRVALRDAVARAGLRHRRASAPIPPRSSSARRTTASSAATRTATWRELITGDYGSILFDANDHGRAGHELHLRPDHGVRKPRRHLSARRWRRTRRSAEADRIGFIAPFEQSRATNTLYFGTYRLFREPRFRQDLDRRPPGTLRSDEKRHRHVSAIGVSQSDAHVIYTGFAHGRVMVTRNEGLTWTDITRRSPGPLRSARSPIDPANPDVAYVGFSGYATDHVFLTRDGGATWETLAAGLPDTPVNALLIRDRTSTPARTSASSAGTARLDVFQPGDAAGDRDGLRRDGQRHDPRRAPMAAARTSWSCGSSKRRRSVRR